MNKDSNADLSPNKRWAQAQPPPAPEAINVGDTKPRLLMTKILTGKRVANRADETLGTISDVILDVEEGRIAGVVIAFGGFMGVGERLFALPWEALTADTARACYIVDADTTTFENAPGFDLKDWPESPFEHGKS